MGYYVSMQPEARAAWLERQAEADRDEDFAITLLVAGYRVAEARSRGEDWGVAIGFERRALAFSRRLQDHARRLRGQLPRSERPRCGAPARSTGRPCQAPVVWDAQRDRPRNGKCKCHGGASTGPKTAEGRKRIRAAQKARWARWRAQRASVAA